MFLLFSYFVFCVYLLSQQCTAESGGDEAKPLWKSHLKVATIEQAPFLYRKDESFDGFLPALMGLIMKDLGNITVEYYLTPAETQGTIPYWKYGHAKEDGSWTGLIGEVVSKRADVAAGPLTITTERSRAVTFSFPFMTANVIAVMKKPSRPGAKLPFRNLKEMTEKAATKGKLTYGIVLGGATEMLFKDSNYTYLKEMYQQIQRKNEMGDNPFVYSYEEAIERVRNDSSYAFLGEDASLEFSAGRRPCDLILLGHRRPLNTAYYGLAFPADVPNEFINRVNMQLISLQRTGQLRFLIDKWWDSDCPKPKLCMCHDPDDDHHHPHHHRRGKHMHNTTSSEESGESHERVVAEPLQSSDDSISGNI